MNVMKRDSRETLFTIEKGIPLPYKTWIDRYPFAQMEVGDSFIFSKECSAHMQQKAVCAVIYWRKHFPIAKDRKLVTRKGDWGVRIFRTK